MSSEPFAMRRSGLTALALLAAGCTIFDTRPEVRLVPPGPHLTARYVTLRAEGPPGNAKIDVDGHEVGSVPVGVDFAIDFLNAPDGKHEVVARIVDGELVRYSEPVEVVLDTVAPGIRFDPERGPYESTEPFVVTLSFDEPVLLADPQAVQLVAQATGEAVAATLTLDGSGRSLRVETAVRLDDTGPVELTGQVVDRLGHAAYLFGYSPRWYAPVVPVRLRVPSSSLSGVVQVEADWSGDLPAVDVLLDGAILATLAPGASLSWDTREVPDGGHQLWADAPGYEPSPILAVQVDNSPATVVSCTPRFTRPDDAAFHRGVEALFSEEVCSDYRWNTCYAVGGWSDRAVLYPPVANWDKAGPLTHTFSFAGFADRWGRPVASNPACTVTYPAWRKPWGADPLPLAGELAFEGVGYLAEGPDMANLLRITAADEAVPGVVEMLRSLAPDPWTPDADPISSPGVVASQMRDGLWLETNPDGAIHVRYLDGDGLARDGPVLDSGAVSIALGWNDHTTFPWIETDPAGVRVVRLAAPMDAGWAVSPAANVDPAADATAASAAGGIDLGYGIYPRLAFVEGSAGAAGVLRVREFRPDQQPPAWISLGDVLNRNPAKSASEPLLGRSNWVPFVVWLEDGQVVVRRRDEQAGTWGDAVVLNSDPLVPARSPRVGLHRIVFVERGPEGDRFEVREWDEVASSWRRLSPLPAGGDVAWFAVGRPLTAILWGDPGGAVRLRVFNE